MENNKYENEIETLDGNVEDINYEENIVQEDKKKRTF